MVQTPAQMAEAAAAAVTHAIRSGAQQATDVNAGAAADAAARFAARQQGFGAGRNP
jgi:hypothetical protein